MGRPKGSKNKPKDVEVPVEVNGDEEQKPLGKPHYADRTSVLNEIAETNKEMAEEEDLEEEEVEEEPKEVEVDTETVDETDEPVEETEEPAKRKFVVDGVEREFTDEEITRIVQKSASADKRLEEATRLLEGAKATQRPPAQPSPAPSLTVDVEEDDTLVSDVTDAIAYGDREQIAAAVRKMIGGGRKGPDLATQTQGMNPQQVQDYVIETLAFERGKQLLETPPEQGGYADVWSDPILRRNFQARENELRDNGDNRPYAEVYKEIGEEIRAWQQDFIKKHLPKTGLEDRDEAKRKAGVVRGAGGKPAVSLVESKPLSHEEKIEQLRKARGQT